MCIAQKVPCPSAAAFIPGDRSSASCCCSLASFTPSCMVWAHVVSMMLLLFIHVCYVHESIPPPFSQDNISLYDCVITPICWWTVELFSYVNVTWCVYRKFPNCCPTDNVKRIPVTRIFASTWCAQSFHCYPFWLVHSSSTLVWTQSFLSVADVKYLACAG